MVGLNFATIRPAIVPNAATNRLEWGVAPTAPARTSTIPANWLPTEFATRRVPTSTDRLPKWLPTTATVWERLQINNLLGYSLGCRLVFFSTDTRELLVSVPLFVYACMVPLQILLIANGCESPEQTLLCHHAFIPRGGPSENEFSLYSRDSPGVVQIRIAWYTKKYA